MSDSNRLAVLDYSPDAILEQALARHRRVLLFGEPGIGKSTLARTLARAVVRAGREAWAIDADPGSPNFGIPGAVCLGRWQGDDWDRLRLEALCTLDPGRFRLPFVSAVRRLAAQHPSGVLFIDPAGVVRGVAGSELLLGLVEAAAVDVVLVLARPGTAPPLAGELAALLPEVFVVEASPAARPGSKRQRARRRTRRWEDYLAHAREQRIRLSDAEFLGTPPPVDIPSAWTGRQVALLEHSRTVALGEVIENDGHNLSLRMPRLATEARVLLVRDARRGKDGLLGTAKTFASTALQYVPPLDVQPYPAPGLASGPCPIARVSAATATLVNGVFGDPFLHVRLRDYKRSLLFDLGNGSRLPARIAHQVSDVFLSHAHADHIGGFMWLLRSRIGDFPACRLFGPPGIAENIAGLVSGIRWDRIGANAPRFEIGELHETRLVRFRVRAGRRDCSRIDETTVQDGILREERTFRVRAVTVDHGTPVLAFAFEQPNQLNIRKDRLVARKLPGGPWLTDLKEHLAREELDAAIPLPDGRVEQVGTLADQLVLVTPGRNLVFATDLADTPANRRRLTALAKGAHTFFCEAAFLVADSEQATRTGHLTTRACGEIATAAGVEHLIPFHFSKRYANDPARVYEEVRAACSRTVVPKQIAASEVLD